MKNTKWTTGALLIVGAMLLVGGCDKLTRAHYEMIVLNVSTTDDVARTIGPPNIKMDTNWNYERVDKHLSVIIDFSDDGVVVRKQWIDGMANQWEDTEKPGDSDTYETTQIRTINE